MYSVENRSPNGTCALPRPISDITGSEIYTLTQDTGCTCAQIRNSSLELSVQLVCSEFPVLHTWYAELSYVCLFVSIILLGIAGNATVIWIVLRHPRMRTVTNYFLLNLAVADLSITVLNLSANWYYNMYYVWHLGHVYCKFSSLMGVVPTCASAFTMVVMSYDRYLAIVHPLRQRLSKKTNLSIIVLIWVLAFVCGLPALIHFQLEYFYFYAPRDKGGYSYFVDVLCNDSLDNNFKEIYNLCLFCVNYAIPLTVTALTYAKVALKLWRSEDVGDTRHQDSMRAKRKVVKMFVAVVSIFMICWLPYHCYFLGIDLLLTRVFEDLTIMYIYLSIYVLAMSSTVYNPIIYCYMNNRFRSGFRYAFRWLPWIHMGKSEYRHCDLFESNQRTSRIATITSSTADRKRSSTAMARKSLVTGNMRRSMNKSSPPVKTECNNSMVVNCSTTSDGRYHQGKRGGSVAVKTAKYSNNNNNNNNNSNDNGIDTAATASSSQPLLMGKCRDNADSSQL